MSESDRVQLNVEVPAWLKLRAQHIALDQGKTLTDIVSTALQEFASKHEK